MQTILTFLVCFLPGLCIGIAIASILFNRRLATSEQEAGVSDQ